MPRFEAVLRSIAEGLDLPQPDRARILEEIAGDLEDLRAELVRRGVAEDEAETRAVEILAPTEDAMRALLTVHEPLYRSLARRFSPSGMRRAERAGLLLITFAALTTVAPALLGNGLIREPSHFLIPILILLVALVTMAGRKAVQLFLERDHDVRSLRSGMNTLLLGSGLAVAFAVAGFLFELFALAGNLQESPDRTATLMIPWLLDSAVLLAAGLSTALVGGLCWALLWQKVAAVESAHVLEAHITGRTGSSVGSGDHASLALHPPHTGGLR